MSFAVMLKPGQAPLLEVRFQPEEESEEKQTCPYCHHQFVPWRLPASGAFSLSCPFCSIIALHLFNKTPMPPWLEDYRRGHPYLSASEYTEGIRHLQKLLTNPKP